MKTKITFRWKSSFMGTSFYRVYGDGPDYEISLRGEASDYCLSICNGNNVRKTVLSEIGILRRSSPTRDHSFAVSQDVLNAFNRWRETEHAESMQSMRSQPERYGEITDEYAQSRQPVPARRAEFNFETHEFDVIEDSSEVTAAA